ncbi:MAG: hypothetical protein NWF08_07105 [Candidatus Bathyarchaeota archaeon]|jgi:hypothetical protein|nr:hypothetical protein [Candidatus Bathyarchaeota archaeon]
MGKISKGTECSVERCKENAIKSISAEKIKKTDLKIKEERRAYLCREHYKEFKKKSKKDRTIEKWRLGSRGI